MATKKATEAHVTIKAPNMQTACFTIEGTTPLVISKFATRSRDKLHASHEAGSTSRKGSAKEPKDFRRCFEEATYRDSKEGWPGFNASGIRHGLISACRLVGFKMVLAKLSVFVEADGWDDHVPLVRIDSEPEYFETVVRNASGVVDLRARPKWNPGWRATLRIRFDADQFAVQDVTNLLMRVGMQGGIGEGRPDSKQSAGMGWGLFRIVNEAEQKKVA